MGSKLKRQIRRYQKLHGVKYMVAREAVLKNWSPAEDYGPARARPSETPMPEVIRVRRARKEDADE